MNRDKMTGRKVLLLAACFPWTSKYHAFPQSWNLFRAPSHNYICQSD